MLRNKISVENACMRHIYDAQKKLTQRLFKGGNQKYKTKDR